MKNSRFWGACVLTIACLAALPAQAIVILQSEYEVGTTRGAAGVDTGDIVRVSAFYDPLYATLVSLTDSEATYTFGAEHAGLNFTVGDQVWRTTGPLTIQTWVDSDNLGRDKRVAIQFLGHTRVVQDGQVPTTLETPWSALVTGQESLTYLPEFTARAGLDANEVLGPRLYTEADFASLLTPTSRLPTVGTARASTASGTISFSLADPNYVEPVLSVPEPGVLMLFGMGLLGLGLFRKRAAPQALESAA